MAGFFLFPIMDTTETKPAETTLVTASDLVTPLGERMPGVTESAVTREPLRENNTPVPEKEIRDSNGQLFNSGRHAVNADGSPKLGKKGNFILSQEYRKNHNRAAPSPEPAKPAITSFAKTEPEKPAPTFATDEMTVDPNMRGREQLQDEYDFAAEVYLQSFYGPIIIAFTEEARPEKDDHAALKTALANWLRVKQIKEPSPGWAVIFVAAAVAAKKASIPVVKERALTIGSKIKTWLFPRKFVAPQIKPTVS